MQSNLFDGQTSIWDFMDQDEPGSLCRFSGKAPTVIPARAEMTPCEGCKRRVMIRSDWRYPRHYVPVR